jgi:hypothetical protein
MAKRSHVHNSEGRLALASTEAGIELRTASPLSREQDCLLLHLFLCMTPTPMLLSSVQSP